MYWWRKSSIPKCVSATVGRSLKLWWTKSYKNQASCRAVCKSMPQEIYRPLQATMHYTSTHFKTKSLISCWTSSNNVAWQIWSLSQFRNSLADIEVFKEVAKCYGQRMNLAFQTNLLPPKVFPFYLLIHQLQSIVHDAAPSLHRQPKDVTAQS